MDHRGDLYSVGVILFELLTGRLPFTGSETMDVLLAHATQAPPSFASVGAYQWVSPTVEAVVLRCLAKDPKDRPATARELAEMYDAALAGLMPGAILPLMLSCSPRRSRTAMSKSCLGVRPRSCLGKISIRMCWLTSCKRGCRTRLRPANCRASSRMLAARSWKACRVEIRVSPGRPRQRLFRARQRALVLVGSGQSGRGHRYGAVAAT